jgi:hypothetical protein
MSSTAPIPQHSAAPGDDWKRLSDFETMQSIARQIGVSLLHWNVHVHPGVIAHYPRQSPAADNQCVARDASPCTFSASGAETGEPAILAD